MYRRFFLITLFLLSLVAAQAVCTAQPVPAGRIFHAGFEDNLNASVAKGSNVATVVGKPELTAGKVGRGLVVGDLNGSAAVSYATEKNISLERGTVSLWVKPENWQGDDKLNHLFFELPLGQSGYYLLYKYGGSWGLAFYIDPEEGVRAKMVAYKPIKEWQPGQWHHICIAWTKFERMKLYIDGQEAASSAGVSLTEKPMKPQMRFGGAWQSNGDRTVIDEAMVFSRMLSAQEIAGLAGVQQAAVAAAADEPRDIPGVMLTQAVLGQKVLARVYPDALGDPVEAAQLVLLKEGKPVVEQTVKLTAGCNSLQLDLSPLPHAVYEARLNLLRGGAIKATEALRVSKETDDTFETAHQIARKDPVLPPFTPLLVTGNTVECWGRQYRFNQSGLLAEVTSRGQKLLASGVRVAQQGDDATAAGPATLEVIDTSPSTAHLRGKVRRGSFEQISDITIRYDGTVWTSLNFKPLQAVELTKLTLEVPVEPEVAEYFAYNAMGRADAKRYGYDRLPTEQGIVFEREFMPSIWLGTEDLGLGWYAESDQNWDIDGEEALTIERRGAETVLCMNVIRHPRRVEREFRIEFGLQATPVRPLQADWRSYQWLPSVDISDYFLGLRKNPYPRPKVEGKTPSGKIAYLYAYHEYFTATLPKDPEEFREMVSRAKGYGLLATPYTDTTFFPEWHGDYLLNQQMRTLPGARGASYGPVCTIACCHQGQFGDWFVWYIKHLATEYGSNGIYLDDMWPYGCSNAAHGCGYDGPDGKRRITYPLRARLETYRRLREMFVEKGEPFWISYHMSAGRCSPLPTFADALLLAEERNPIVGKNPDYTENTTSDEWLASFSPEAWGIPVVMLPQFKMNSAWMKDTDLAEKLLAAVVPHDIQIWPLFVDPEPLMRVRKTMEQFGVEQPDVKLLPFWHKNTGIKVTDARVRVTGYLRAGKLLLCVGNLSKEDVTLPVELDLKALGLAADAKGVNAETGEVVPVTGGRLVVKAPAKRLQLIEVR
ncbi:MAG: glycoside hydrolase domain-containing protein [Armatimonadota bacterium]